MPSRCELRLMENCRDRFWMKRKRLHRMSLASSNSAYIKRNSRQKSAILRKLSSEVWYSCNRQRSYHITPIAVWRSI